MNRTLIYITIILLILAISYRDGLKSQRQTTTANTRNKSLGQKTIHSRSPASTPGATKSLRDSESLLEELHIVLNCKESDCGFSNHDPRELELKRSRKVLSIYQELSQKPMDTSDREALIWQAIQSPEAIVKQGALELIKDQAPEENQKYLSSLLNEFLNSPSPKLVQMTLLELTKFKNPHEVEKIHGKIIEQLVSGPLVSKKEILQMLPILLDRKSVAVYKRNLQRIRQPSIRRQVSQLLIEISDFS